MIAYKNIETMERKKPTKKQLAHQKHHYDMVEETDRARANILAHFGQLRIDLENRMFRCRSAKREAALDQEWESLREARTAALMALSEKVCPTCGWNAGRL